MNPILYVGCPAAERAETEKLLAAADVTVVWAESMAYVVHELQRRDMPVLLDLSRGAAALQIARDLRSERASTLMGSSPVRVWLSSSVEGWHGPPACWAQWA